MQDILINSLLEGNHGCFQHFAIRNKATTNIHMQVILGTFFFKRKDEIMFIGDMKYFQKSEFKRLNLMNLEKIYSILFSQLY